MGQALAPYEGSSLWQLRSCTFTHPSLSQLTFELWLFGTAKSLRDSAASSLPSWQGPPYLGEHHPTSHRPCDYRPRWRCRRVWPPRNHVTALELVVRLLRRRRAPHFFNLEGAATRPWRSARPQPRSAARSGCPRRWRGPAPSSAAWRARPRTASRTATRTRGP